MPCIYYGDKPNLTYNSQEHVFPLGLGGIQMLPKGAVSDQANNEFSKLELHFMRESFVSFNRSMEGPGSTSKHKHSAASESRVTVGMTDKPTLGYLISGKPHVIYQFCVFEKHAGLSMPTDGNIEVFKGKLRNYQNQFVYLQSRLLNENDFIVGYHKGKYYVATKTQENRDIIASRLKFEISRFLNAKENTNFIEESNLVTLDVQINESNITERAYAKVALNILTHLFGIEYTSNNFSELKEWIVSGIGKNVYTKRVPSNDVTCIDQLVPESSHWCYFQPIDGHLAGVICFYNNSVCKRFLDFGIVDYPDKYPNGFICDWKNQREYTLLDLISLPEDEIAKNIAGFQKRLKLNGNLGR